MNFCLRTTPYPDLVAIGVNTFDQQMVLPFQLAGVT